MSSFHFQFKGDTESSPTEQKDDISAYNVVNNDKIDDDDTQDHQCGLCSLRCKCLQVFAHPNMFVFNASLLFMTMVGATGIYLAGVISTIEKEFQLKSSESGVLMSMNDISALSGVLFVAYIGGKSHRPRIIGVSGLLVAVGSFVSALPQFILDTRVSVDGGEGGGQQSSSRYNPEDFTCNAPRNTTNCTAAEIDDSGSQLLSKGWPIILGQLLSGFGSSAILPLSITYIDDAVDKSLSPIYLALQFLPMSIAPILGFGISNICLSIYTDFYKSDTPAGLTPNDPQWMGAWWLGFIIYGCCMLVFSLPMFLFPRKMNKPKSYFCIKGMPACCKDFIKEKADQKLAMMEEEVTQLASSSKLLDVVKDFFTTLLRLATNGTYVFVVLGICCVMIAFSGLSSFAAKYIENEFQVDPGWAGLLLGITSTPSSLIGIFLGGILTSRLAGTHNLRGYITLAIVFHILGVVALTIMMLIGCSNDNVVGVTAQYGSKGLMHSQGLNASCNMNCKCQTGVYSPVCGADGMMYVTACFAGCQTVDVDKDNGTIFHDCSCINTNQIGFRELEAFEPGLAVKGVCPTTCNTITVFLVSLGTGMAIKTIAINPSFMLQFRSVSPGDRELALGLGSFLNKLLGFIPAPILFGSVIESQCLYSQESCGKSGDCKLYDRPGLRTSLFGLAAGLRACGVLCFLTSAIIIFGKTSPKKTAKEEESIKDKAEKEDVEE